MKEGHDQLCSLESRKRKERQNIQAITSWRSKRIKIENYMDNVSYESKYKKNIRKLSSARCEREKSGAPNGSFR